MQSPIFSRLCSSRAALTWATSPVTLRWVLMVITTLSALALFGCGGHKKDGY